MKVPIQSQSCTYLVSIQYLPSLNLVPTQSQSCTQYQSWTYLVSIQYLPSLNLVPTQYQSFTYLVSIQYLFSINLVPIQYQSSTQYLPSIPTQYQLEIESPSRLRGKSREQWPVWDESTYLVNHLVPSTFLVSIQYLPCINLVLTQYQLEIESPSRLREKSREQWPLWHERENTHLSLPRGKYQSQFDCLPPRSWGRFLRLTNFFLTRRQWLGYLPNCISVSTRCSLKFADEWIRTRVPIYLKRALRL